MRCRAHGCAPRAQVEYHAQVACSDWPDPNCVHYKGKITNTTTNFDADGVASVACNLFVDTLESTSSKPVRAPWCAEGRGARVSN